MNLCKEIQGEFKTVKYNCFYFHYQNQCWGDISKSLSFTTQAKRSSGVYY